MSVIYGNPIITNGGVKLNIDYGATPPSDTTKLWVPLATKPSAVECSPALTFGGNTISLENWMLPSDVAFYPNPIAYGGYLYLVGGGQRQYYGSGSDKIFKVDLKTNQVTELSVKLPKQLHYSFCAEANGKLYILGGCSTQSNIALSDVYIFDPSTESISTGINLSVGIKMNGNYPFKHGFYHNGLIYIVGYITGDSTNNLKVLSYNTANGSTTVGGSVPASGSACSLVGSKIYCLGGQAYSNIYTYDILTGTVKSDGYSSYPYIYVDCASIGKYVYLFTGWYGSALNVIQRFDTETNALEQLSVTMKNKLGWRTVCKYGLDIYILGGKSQSGNPTLEVEKFSASSPLSNNHLFLQEDYGYDGLWTALKSKDTDFKVKVINAYLGDNNNIAQLTNAYLYDTSSNQWKSLSGESYVADMQNALNILGVN